MSKVKQLVGKEVKHTMYGKVLVTGPVKGSRTKVRIKCIQRKEGWNEFEEKYEPVMKVRPNPSEGKNAKTIYYTICNRDEYGVEDEVHIKTLV